MYEARNAGGGRRAEHGGGAVDVGAGETGAVGSVDCACDVDDGVGSRDQRGERGGVVECAGDPGDAVAVGLRPAGKCADMVAGGRRLGQQVAADEAGRAGDGNDGHSSTM